VTQPIFWLGLSILLVAVSLTAVLVVALPALQELSRAARSAQKLFDTLTRELPPTLEAIRLTGLEISDLTDDLSEGVKSAGQVVKRVDRSLGEAQKQAQRVQGGTRKAFVGVRAAWKSLTRPAAKSLERLSSERELSEKLAEAEIQLPPKPGKDSQVEEFDRVATEALALERRRDRDFYPQPTTASTPTSTSAPLDPTERQATDQETLDSLLEDFSEEKTEAGPEQAQER